MTALSALRKARATVKCPHQNRGVGCWSSWLAQQADNVGLINHRWSASALLDNQAVAAVTRAEEALEREGRRGR